MPFRKRRTYRRRAPAVRRRRILYRKRAPVYRRRRVVSRRKRSARRRVVFHVRTPFTSQIYRQKFTFGYNSSLVFTNTDVVSGQVFINANTCVRPFVGSDVGQPYLWDQIAANYAAARVIKMKASVWLTDYTGSAYDGTYVACMKRLIGPVATYPGPGTLALTSMRAGQDNIKMMAFKQAPSVKTSQKPLTMYWSASKRPRAAKDIEANLFAPFTTDSTSVPIQHDMIVFWIVRDGLSLVTRTLKLSYMVSYWVEFSAPAPPTDS